MGSAHRNLEAARGVSGLPLSPQSLDSGVLELVKLALPVSSQVLPCCRSDQPLRGAQRMTEEPRAGLSSMSLSQLLLLQALQPPCSEGQKWKVGVSWRRK